MGSEDDTYPALERHIAYRRQLGRDMVEANTMTDEAAQRIADQLGGMAYPDGKLWRCHAPGCTFATDDDGPDRCPTHDAALWRTSVTIPAQTTLAPSRAWPSREIQYLPDGIREDIPARLRALGMWPDEDEGGTNA